MRLPSPLAPRPLALALAAAISYGLVPIALYANDLPAGAIVQAQLLAEPSAATPGTPFTAAVRLRVPAGWHLSWRNPGDAGVPPSLRWDLPAQVTAGEIQWPAPRESRLGPVTIYALDGDVWLLVELVPARALPAENPLRIGVLAEWLVCKELCIPEKAQLALELPLVEKPAPPGTDEAGFLAARSRLPRALGWTAALGRQQVSDGKPGTAQLQIATGDLALAGAQARFFPYQAGVLEPGAEQALELSPSGISLTLRRPAGARAPLAQVSGVLVVQGTDERDRVAAELATLPPPSAASALPIWLALICAFAGGLLLNLMPCVLPVLGFKVLSLVRDASRGERRARIGGLAYAAGVVVSFWLLAALLFALRASGRELGWGFQLQSPAVVSLLSLLFFGLGLSFLGFAEFGFALQTRAGALRFSASAWGAFASGVLATAVATPCTAPFMGTALGAALVSPPWVALAIFTALGLGMAWPYAFLSLWPALLTRVPRPGPWMKTLQQALAFPLFATVLWLLSVLAAQAGPEHVTAALGAMLFLGFALWLWRVGGALEAPRGQRVAAGSIALALALLSAWGAAFPRPLAQAHADADAAARSLASAPSAARLASGAPDADAQVAWLDWSAEKFAQLRAEKRTVFVDFTAAWCISCQVNERLIFSSPAVRARFASLGVVPLRADWTRSDPSITRALESFGRSGVPLNLVAGPRTSEPLVLPAMLTPGMVLSALEQAAPVR